MYTAPSEVPAVNSGLMPPFYLAVLDALPVAVIVTDFSGHILYLNPAALRLIGMNRDSVRGHQLSDAITLLDGTSRQAVGDPLTRFISRSERPRSGEFDVLQLARGVEIPVEYSCAILRGLNQNSDGIVLLLRDATTLRELAQEATHDSLTRLTNRHQFELRLGRLLETLRPGDAHALLYMDLDHFKEINDTYGHAAGDFILCQVAELFVSRIRERDTLARLGGDEFVLLLEHCPIALANEHAEAISRAISGKEFSWSGVSIRLAVSVGAVAIVSRTQTTSSVLAAADRACYAVKRRAGTGRTSRFARFRLFPAHQQEAQPIPTTRRHS